jgi:hypothetical protein
MEGTMKNIVYSCFILVAIFVFSIPVIAAENVQVTVYNQNFGVVKEQRTLDLEKGVNTLKFEDVAKFIDATSVKFKSLTDPDGTTVIEQNYEYDLVSADKLLQKFLGKSIRVITKDGKLYEGTLMSYDAGQIVLMKEDAVSMVARADNVQDIQFPELPEGLITKPTLVWNVNAGKSGKHNTEIAYITNNINWNVDYTLVTNKDDTAIDLNGWVTITNQTGASYEDAKLKLIAGDVNRIQPERASRDSFSRTEFKSLPASAGFVEKEFFEYHLYNLPRATTIKDNQIKQIELLNSTGAKVEKFYVYDGLVVPPRYYNGRYTDQANYGIETNKKVQVYIEFENKKDNKLGMPLPKGKVRLYKRDEEDKSLEFIGEDMIDHTPKDEKVRLRIGNAFDIVGERKQTNFKVISPTVVEESFEIEVRNHKKTAVMVRVVEHLYRWSEWEIVAGDKDYKKMDARTIEYYKQIPADGNVKFEYTVRYKW